jgi:hypothetical protein
MFVPVVYQSFRGSVDARLLIGFPCASLAKHLFAERSWCKHQNVAESSCRNAVTCAFGPTFNGPAQVNIC